MEGSDTFVESIWKSMNVDELNGLIRLNKKLQCLKNAVKVWVRETRTRLLERKKNIKLKLSDVDKIIDQGKEDLERIVSYCRICSFHKHTRSGIENHTENPRKEIESFGCIEMKNKEYLQEKYKKKVGNGENTSFWDENWLGDDNLKSIYPRLYALEEQKSISVAVKLQHPSLVHSFRGLPRGGVEEVQLDSLHSRTSVVILPNTADRWVWSLDASGSFLVKFARNFIDDIFLPKVEVPTRWVKVIPIKVNIFTWRVYLDKIPTRLNLSTRGIDIPSILCPICNSSVEFTSHVFFSCSLAWHLISKISRGWEIDDTIINNYGDWLNWLINIRLPTHQKTFLEGIGFENPSYFEKAKDLRPSLYDEKIIGLGYTLMFLIHSDEALEIEKFKRARENKIEFAYDYGNLNANLDTFSSVRRPKHSDVIWKKKGLSNTSFVDLSSVSLLKLNTDVKRYSRKDLLSCNNYHLGETSCAYVCNDAMNISCNIRMCDFFDENNLFIFDDESVRISLVSKMPFRKKIRDSMNIVQIYLWIIDSGCSKHMTGNRALLTNFVEKFFGTVRFENNDFVVITGYGDVVIGST
nr:RNA-directed DNA polymerase, eukaryota [Tanacetum cinerariifolium]